MHDIGYNDPFSYFVFDQKVANSTKQAKFVTEPRELFCYVFSPSEELTSFQTTLWKYFCEVSATNKIDGYVYFGYNCILALRVSRFLKITYKLVCIDVLSLMFGSNEKIQGIIISIRKAVSSMAMIFLVFALILMVYSIIIYSLFQDAGEASDIEYNEVAEEMNLNRTLFKVSLHLDAIIFNTL